MRIGTRTLIVVAAAACTLVNLGGCGSLVSWNKSLDTAYGPAAERTTYRVGGERTEDHAATRVYVIRHADSNIAVGAHATNSAGSVAPTNGGSMNGQTQGAMPMPMYEPGQMQGMPTPTGAPTGSMTGAMDTATPTDPQK